jgi:hypothetical protein
MADSMVERVARALCSLETDSGPNLLTGIPRWHGYVSAARAAISAMREPTPQMADAAYERQRSLNCPVQTGLNYSAIYETMIDAALKDSP